MKLKLKVCRNLEEVRKFTDKGYCPVRCVEGKSVIVDELKLSPFENDLAIRVSEEHHGARFHDPRFVTRWNIGDDIDAETCLIVAMLAGIVLVVPKAVAHVTSQFNIDPVGLNLTKHGIFLTWMTLIGSGEECVAETVDFYRGVMTWCSLLRDGAEDCGHLHSIFKAVCQNEEMRRKKSFDVIKRIGHIVEGILVLKGSSPNLDFSTWFGRFEDSYESFTSPAGWRFPVVVVWTAPDGQLHIRCPNVEVAEKMFGKGGLQGEFWANLESKKVWQGNNAYLHNISKLKWEEVEEIIGNLASCIKYWLPVDKGSLNRENLISLVHGDGYNSFSRSL